MIKAQGHGSNRYRKYELLANVNQNIPVVGETYCSCHSSLPLVAHERLNTALWNGVKVFCPHDIWYHPFSPAFFPLCIEAAGQQSDILVLLAPSHFTCILCPGSLLSKEGETDLVKMTFNIINRPTVYLTSHF